MKCILKPGRREPRAQNKNMSSHEQFVNANVAEARKTFLTVLVVVFRAHGGSDMLLRKSMLLDPASWQW